MFSHNVRCVNYRVREVVEDYERGTLAEPHYQREFVWDILRQKALVAKILRNRFVPAAVTIYTIDEHPTTFLEDGKQRITTLSLARKNPADFDLTPSDVDALMESELSVHKYVWGSHDEAMHDFQALNSQGTGLIPYELYRGEIEKTDNGKYLYPAVRQAVAEISSRISGIPVSKSKVVDMTNTKNRKRAGQLARGALGLFYMWLTGKTAGKKETQIFNAAIRPNITPIEVKTFLAIKDMTRKELEQKVRNFCDYLEKLSATVQEIVYKRGMVQTKKKWDEQAVRAIFAAGIHVKNRKDLHLEDFEAAVTWYLDKCENKSKWCSRFYSADSAGIEKLVRMSQLNLSWLQTAADHGGPNLIAKRRPEVAGVEPKAGFHKSHKSPIGTGDGSTVPENALSNMSRGRQPMTIEELQSLTTPLAGLSAQQNTANNIQTTFSFNTEVDN